MLYRVVVWIVKFGTSILCRVDAPDLDKVPMKGPLIVYTNHTGQIEVAVLFGHLQPRPMTGWAKAESWDNAFLRWLFNLWRIIPVRRGEGDTTALRLIPELCFWHFILARPFYRSHIGVAKIS